MKMVLCPFFCAFWPLSVLAGADQPISTRSAEAPIEFKITKEFCQRLILDHKPRTDVAYQAGVDVKGTPVVSADINTFHVDVPEKIRIPVVLKKKQELEINAQTGIFKPTGTLKSPYVDEIPLGFVDYELKTGFMSYNGKKMSSNEESLLRQKCQGILEK